MYDALAAKMFGDALLDSQVEAMSETEPEEANHCDYWRSIA